jgi:hypothetical protein
LLSFTGFVFIFSSPLAPSLFYLLFFKPHCICRVAVKMATTVRKFPVIKEVRTFLVEGVGSGGDYHNVSYTFP